MKEVVIVSAARTPIGSFQGVLSNISATELGGYAIKGAINKINIENNLIDEIFMGNVLQANLGQAPARQAAKHAGLSDKTPCTTINKVCSSGMKAIMIGAQSIICGDNDIVVAGGMENMSQVPHYIKEIRNGKKLGDMKIIDGLVNDGLIDVYNQSHMGVCAEKCAEEMNFSREDQDEFAINSYQKSEVAWNNNKFSDEIITINLTDRKGNNISINEDEEYKKIKIDKVSKLRPVFKKEGTITAANASTLNDGASAVILMSLEKAKALNIEPIARIISYSDAAQEPTWFTTTPAKAINTALDKCNISKDKIDYFELNEAFSVVGLANIKLLDINKEKVNVNGGAVSLGHPLGNSGSRIIVTLLNVLKQNNGKIGAAGICNGGGGASAIIIELM